MGTPTATAPAPSSQLPSTDSFDGSSLKEWAERLHANPTQAWPAAKLSPCATALAYVRAYRSFGAAEQTGDGRLNSWPRRAPEAASTSSPASWSM